MFRLTEDGKLRSTEEGAVRSLYGEATDSVQVFADGSDITNQIRQGTLTVSQKLTYQVDSCSFQFLRAGSKTYLPQYGHQIAVYDGETKVFGGIVLSAAYQPFSGAGGKIYQVQCVDHSYDMDRHLVSRTYENETVAAIVADMVGSYAEGFTTGSVTSSFVIKKIVFNQVPLSQCIKRLAVLLNYDWYVDEDRDIHFFAKETLTAPFDAEDGYYVPMSLRRNDDGSQVANRVKVRGGEYDGDVFSDSITVTGADTKALTLPYRFSNLSVTLDTGGGPVAKTVGIDNIDTFATKDVLYNFAERSIRFENDLSDGDVVAFSGNKKVRVFAVSEDSDSIEELASRGLGDGAVEKLIRDQSIESNEVARRRANAELYAIASEITDITYETRTPGLRAGMTQGFEGDFYVVKELAFVPDGHDGFRYKVGLVTSRRHDFVTMLQNLMEPDPTPGDESEVSEQIFTDTAVVRVAEETSVVNPVTADETVTASENYVIDPLGAGTDADYVLSPYAPTGQTDTKRPGRLDISFRVY